MLTLWLRIRYHQMANPSGQSQSKRISHNNVVLVPNKTSPNINHIQVCKVSCAYEPLYDIRIWHRKSPKTPPCLFRICITRSVSTVTKNLPQTGRKTFPSYVDIYYKKKDIVIDRQASIQTSMSTTIRFSLRRPREPWQTKV